MSLKSGRDWDFQAKKGGMAGFTKLNIYIDICALKPPSFLIIEHRLTKTSIVEAQFTLSKTHLHVLHLKTAQA